MIAYADLDRALEERQSLAEEWASETSGMLEATGFVSEDVLAFARACTAKFEELVGAIAAQYPALPHGGAFEAALRAMWCDGLLVGARVREAENA